MQNFITPYLMMDYNILIKIIIFNKSSRHI